MKITENKKGRCTGCCAAALFAGLDGTYDFLLVAPVFLYPAAKDAKNHLTNCYGGGYYIGKAGSTKKGSEHAEKIVRLILMSNISRRKFLKGAGVAALAVAAAGVLAGCSDQSTPDTGKKRPIKLKYMVTTQGESIVKDVPIEVPALADTVTFATIQANVPAELKDYEFDSTEDKKIIDGVVVIKMHKKAAAKPQKKVTIEYVYGTGAPDDAKFTPTSLNVDVDAKYLTQDQLDSLVDKSGKYRVLNATELIGFGGMTQNGIIEGDKATVYITEK